jgi:hypothetical protein
MESLSFSAFSSVSSSLSRTKNSKVLDIPDREADKMAKLIHTLTD